MPLNAIVMAVPPLVIILPLSLVKVQVPSVVSRATIAVVAIRHRTVAPMIDIVVSGAVARWGTIVVTLSL